MIRSVLREKHGCASSLLRLHIANENLVATHYSPVLERHGHKTQNKCKSRAENKLKMLVGQDVGGSTTGSRKKFIYNTFNEKGIKQFKTPCVLQPLNRQQRQAKTREKDTEQRCLKLETKQDIFLGSTEMFEMLDVGFQIPLIELTERPSAAPFSNAVSQLLIF